VRAVEEAVRDRQAGGPRPPATDEPASGAAATPGNRTSPPRLRPPGLLELEELLADHLSTSVEVTMSAKRGKIVIDFADLEDLERLYYLMNPTGLGQPATQSE
jgi:ParB family chromosome partitioning protein